MIKYYDYHCNINQPKHICNINYGILWYITLICLSRVLERNCHSLLHGELLGRFCLRVALFCLFDSDHTVH